jgi:hypothetical protein
MMMTIPQYEIIRLDDGVVKITFDPPVTKATLGIPCSFLVLQEKETILQETRFGRIAAITCRTERWLSYLKTSGQPVEIIEEFKETVGYQEPEPVVVAEE